MRRRRQGGILVSPAVALSAVLAMLPASAGEVGPADDPRQVDAAPSCQEPTTALEPLPAESAACRAVTGPPTGRRIRVLEPLPADEQLQRTVLDERLFDAAEATGAELPAAELPAAEPPDVDGAFEMVRSWAEAWSSQDVDRYLSFYSRAFASPGVSRQDWESSRRQRISQPGLIAIEISSLQGSVATPAGTVRISFRQAYAADTYSDVVRKTLELVREDGGWKILREKAENWR